MKLCGTCVDSALKYSLRAASAPRLFCAALPDLSANLVLIDIQPHHLPSLLPPPLPSLLPPHHAIHAGTALFTDPKKRVGGKAPQFEVLPGTPAG